MNRLATLLTSAALMMLATPGLSATVTGKWNGKLAATFAPAQGAGSFTPEQVKSVQGVLNGIKIVLTVSADGTYVAITKGANEQDQTTKGKWTLKGKTLTLTPNGKNPDAEVGTVSADGKSLTMSLPKNMTRSGVSGRAVFTKG